MNFWEKITGSDMDKTLAALNLRIKKLPKDYQQAWNEISQNFWIYSNLSGRNLMPIYQRIVDFLEEAAAEGQSAKQALGDDVPAFCRSIAHSEGAKSFRDKWRRELNQNVTKKLKRY